MNIIAGSLGHWFVNKESKMTEIFLKSCQKSMSKNNMSKNQHGMKFNQQELGDQGEITIFLRSSV